MNPLANRRVRRLARQGGDVHDIINAEIGPRQAFNPLENASHGFAAEKLGSLPNLIEEAQEDVFRIEEQLARHANPLFLGIGVGSLFLAEVFGSGLVMASIGLEPPELPILSAMLAGFLFFITGLSAKTLTGKRSRWYLLVLLAYGIFVLALALLRAQEVFEDTESLIIAWAVGIVMLATTIGPALGAEILLRRVAEAAPLRRRRRQLLKRIRRLQKELRNAQGLVEKVSRDAEQWDRRAARIESQAKLSLENQPTEEE